MTTFAKRSFDAASYLRYRPTYPRSLISFVLEYASVPDNAVALDLGCGPGQATALLAASGRVQKVTGMDPSQGMVEAAQTAIESDIASLLGEAGTDTEAVKNVQNCKVDYAQGSAEDLESLEKESLDLVTAGQAAHWFEHRKAYQQIANVLKPGGTLAYWGYAYMFIPDAPLASERIMSLGLNKLGPYWEPGRKGPESLYDLLPFPQEGPWDEKTFQRVKFDQTSSEAYKQQKEDAPPPPATRHFPVAMSKRMTRDGLMRSLKTWSSVHNYMEKHPSGENVIDSFYNEVVELLPTEEPFDVQWPVGMLLMQKQK